MLRQQNGENSPYCKNSAINGKMTSDKSMREGIKHERPLTTII
ncbi:MAG: hypothetical protein K0Q87_4622 [Neobacillus sp.]|jgi:hypothetical protein|nr:hypothetical protein [Neobacillus sp.]